MTNESIVTMAKKWIDWELETNVKKIGADNYLALNRSYGIIMFTCNALLDYDSPESKELIAFWENKMLPKFKKIS